MYADVVWDRVAVEDDELSFRVGDVIEILDMTDDIWWHGSVHEDSGWFPSTFVRVCGCMNWGSPGVTVASVKGRSLR